MQSTEYGVTARQTGVLNSKGALGIQVGHAYENEDDCVLDRRCRLDVLQTTEYNPLYQLVKSVPCWHMRSVMFARCHHLLPFSTRCLAICRSKGRILSTRIGASCFAAYLL